MIEAGNPRQQNPEPEQPSGKRGLTPLNPWAAPSDTPYAQVSPET